MKLSSSAVKASTNTQRWADQEDLPGKEWWESIKEKPKEK